MQLRLSIKGVGAICHSFCPPEPPLGSDLAPHHWISLPSTSLAYGTWAPTWGVTNQTTPDLAAETTETEKQRPHSINLIGQGLALAAAILFPGATVTIHGAGCSAAGTAGPQLTLPSLALSAGRGCTDSETVSMVLEIVNYPPIILNTQSLL